MPEKATLSNTLESSLETWGQVSAYLMKVERQEAWKATARTFTEWAKAYAERRGCTVTLLWRYKSAGKFYQERRQSLAHQGVKLPSLERIDASVSAEAVELLAKLTRVAPPDVLERIEVPTLKGEIEKKEVRALWDVYSPLLKGKTARGRGVEAPKVTISDVSRAEADVLLGLRQSSGSWLGETPAMHEVYLATEVANEVGRRFIGCDILAISRTDRRQPVVIHGIEVKILPLYRPFKEETFEWLANHVDFAWLATPTRVSARDMADVPTQVGILYVGESGVSMLRPAEPFKRTRSSAESLARDLLARALRWWK